MNKNFYRIVFNQARGLFIVVSEIVKSHQAISGKSQRKKDTNAQADIIGKKKAVLKPIVFLSYVVLGMVSVVSNSYAGGVVVDPNAGKNQRPNVQELNNGTTQVDIVSPTKGGISHNKFTQFDVSKDGLILNNSLTDTNTELAGNINGNKRLRNNARVILNEVNSNNPSQLLGSIEVAGQKAQVVIANAAGITCNGCGFINADRTTLTTGKPIMEDGELKGYDVRQGKIEIQGDGLRSGGQNYTDLISRSVSINAKLWADNEVNIVTGKNKVSADLSKVERQGADSNSDKPEFALDVSALGGMYAGKITMVGTENGVGVRNQGKIYTNAGSINITTDGKVVNENIIDAVGDVSLRSKGNAIENNGKIKSLNKNISLASYHEIKNNGTLQARENVNFSSGSWTGNNGVITAGKTVTAQGNEFNNGFGATIDAQDVDVTSYVTKNTGDMKVKNRIDIKSELTQNQGNMSADNEVHIASKEIINDYGGSISAKHILLQGDKLFNRSKAHASEDLTVHVLDVTNSGELSSNKQVSVVSNIFETNNSAGLVKGENVQFKADKLVNKGVIYSNNNLNILTHEFGNQKDIIAGNQLNIKSESLINDWYGNIVANNADINAIKLINYGKIEPIENLELEVDYLENIGKLQAKQDLKGYVLTLHNRDGATIEGRNINLEGDTLDNKGQMRAENVLDLAFKKIDNYAKIFAKNQVNLNTEYLNNDHGSSIESDHIVKIQAHDFQNRSQIKSADLIEIKAKKEFNNRRYTTEDGTKVIGTLNSGDIKINTESGVNTGEIIASKKAIIFGDSFKNDWYGVIKGGDITISGNKFDNYGSARAEHNFYINSTDVMNASNLLSREYLTINATYFTNNSTGILKSDKQIDLRGDNILNNGLIDTIKAVINAKNFKNDWLGVIKGADISIAGDKFENYGNANALHNFDISSTDVENHNKLYSANYLRFDSNNVKNYRSGELNSNWQIDIKGNQIHNEGSILANHAININGKNIKNDGKLKSNIHIRLSGDKFENSSQGSMITETIHGNMVDFINKGYMQGDFVDNNQNTIIEN